MYLACQCVVNILFFYVQFIRKWYQVGWEDVTSISVSTATMCTILMGIAGCLGFMDETQILSPTPEGECVGKALVQEVFNIGGLGNIGGSKCEDGLTKKGSNVRVMRGDDVLCKSKVSSLRNIMKRN